MVNTGPPPTTGDRTKAAGTHTGNGSTSRAGAADDDAAHPPWPVTTWQGWQHFATTPPPAPPQPGDEPRTTEQRLAYHSAFVTLRTPAIDTLTTQVRTLMILGRHQQHTARPSLIVTGPPAAGKTTALLHARPPPRLNPAACTSPSPTSWSRPARPPKPSPPNSPATSASPPPPA